MVKEMMELIHESKRILVTSHKNPDPDAIGSALFVYSILSENFKDKDICVSIEGEKPLYASFLKNYGDIKEGLLIENVIDFKPDLIIMLDGDSYKRFSNLEHEKLGEYIKNNEVKTIIIDHHQRQDKDESDIYINYGLSSNCEQLYRIFVKELGFKSSKQDNELIMFGIIGDTGRFLFKNEQHKDTFMVVSDLIDSGVSIEKIQSKLSEFTIEHINVINKLFENLSQKEDYNYYYLSDEGAEVLVREGISPQVYSYASQFILNNYLRVISPNRWGFSLLPDIVKGKGYYMGSFRASDGILDTSIFSRVLGGGGHKLASGFDIEANSIEEALDMVHKVIKEKRVEAEDSIKG